MSLKAPYRRRVPPITSESNTRSVAAEAERHWWVSQLQIVLDADLDCEEFWREALRRIIDERTRQ